MNWIAALLALTFHKWIIVFLACYAVGGMILFKLIDRLGKETDSSVLFKRKLLFIVGFLMISIGTFALLKDLNVFEGLRDSYHKALEVIK